MSIELIDGIPRLSEPLPESCIKPRRGRYYAPGTRSLVYERDGSVCFVCKRPDQRVWDPRGFYVTPSGGASLTLHHVIAHVRGGCSHPHNLVTLCSSCNERIGVPS